MTMTIPVLTLMVLIIAFGAEVEQGQVSSRKIRELSRGL
jgi:hypothetical protein